MARAKIKLKSSLRTKKLLLHPGDVIEIDAQTALRYVRLGIAEPLPEAVEASLVSNPNSEAEVEDTDPASDAQPKASAVKGKAAKK